MPTPILTLILAVGIIRTSLRLGNRVHLHGVVSCRDNVFTIMAKAFKDNADYIRVETKAVPVEAPQ